MEAINRQDSIKKIIGDVGKKNVNLDISSITNETIHNAFRVVVYRMELANPVTINYPGAPTSTDSNYILGLDVANIGYRSASKYFREFIKSVFPKFLQDLYISIFNELEEARNGSNGMANSIKDNFRGDTFIKEYDITPLVTDINITLNLEDTNNASFTMIDPSLIDFNTRELNRIYALNPWLSNMAYDIDYKKTLKTLKRFSLKEYDLVRIYIYKGNESLPKRIQTVKDTILGGVEEKGDIGNVLSEYCMKPAFTGFSVSMTNTNTVDATANISVQCLGIARILAQSTMVVDPAVADQIVFQTPKNIGEMPIQKNPLVVTSNIYSGWPSYKIFTDIINKYLFPYNLRSNLTEPDNFIIGKPDTQYLSLTLTQEGEGKRIIANLPGIMTLQNVKEKFREHMYLCDDSTDPDFFALFSLNSKTPTNVSGGELYSFLRTYLGTIKNNFELYDSTYECPWSIFQTTRDSAFLEIFEDRSGSFRFRFPRYNKCTLDHYFKFNDLISGTVTRSDSNNFSVVQVKPQIDIKGPWEGIMASVYLDPLSIFRYGWRVTDAINNPNALVSELSPILGEFMRFYHASKEARTATIRIIGDPSVEVGQMVGFRLGYRSSKNPGEEDFTTLDNAITEGNILKTYVGYVSSIQETMAVDSMYTQELTLQFVREAKIEKRVSFESKKAMTLMDVIGNPRMPIKSLSGSLRNMLLPIIKDDCDLVLSNIFTRKDALPDNPVTLNTHNDDTLVILKSKTSDVATFDYIDSSLDIAYFLLENSRKIREAQDKNSKRNDPMASASTHAAIYSDIVKSRALGHTVLLEYSRAVAEFSWIDKVLLQMSRYLGGIEYEPTKDKSGRITPQRQMTQDQLTIDATKDLITYGLKTGISWNDYRSDAFAVYGKELTQKGHPAATISNFIHDDPSIASFDFIPSSVPNMPEEFKSSEPIPVLNGTDICLLGSIFWKQVNDCYKQMFPKDVDSSFDVFNKSESLWGIMRSKAQKFQVGGYTVTPATGEQFFSFWVKVVEATKYLKYLKNDASVKYYAELHKIDDDISKNNSKLEELRQSEAIAAKGTTGGKA